MDKKNSKIIKIISFIFVTIVINFLLYDFYVIPKYKRLLSIKNNYKKKEERIALINKNKSNIDSIKESNEALNDNINNLKKLVPNKIDTAALSYEFYNSCITYGISGDEIKFELPQYGNTAEPLTKLTINLKISGTNDKVTAYIANATNITERKLNLKSVALLYQDNNISADIVLYQYIQK